MDSMHNLLRAASFLAVTVATDPIHVSTAQARAQYQYGRPHHHSHNNYSHYQHHARRYDPVASASLWFCNSWWWCGQAAKTVRFGTRWRSAALFRAHREPDRNSVGFENVHGTLAAKAHEITMSCGSTVISGFRGGARIAGSGHPSLHASGRAVDIRGNPGCIYAHLHDWPGGYSVDYGAVQHVHISLGGHEDGMRFTHYSGHRWHHS
jgi:hypothetical protein